MAKGGNASTQFTGNPETFRNDPLIAPFTWDPEAAGLAEPGSAFTADTISFTGYLTDVSQPDDTHVANRIEVFTGFGLNGRPVTPTGFGCDYGLYFEAVDQGTGGPPPHILNFTSVEVALKADPGNQNGAVSSTVSGTGFANTGPTGEADDIILATGSLVAGTLFLDLTPTPPILDGDQVGTFIPTVAGFFQGGSGLLHNFASNPATLLTMTDGPDGTTITNFNGYLGTAQFLSFPAGWSDPSLVDPHSTAPHPSAVVIETTDADGHSTKALATLPGIADSQGIYRPIDPSKFYATRADVRVDQFGDVDPSGAMEDPNNPGWHQRPCDLCANQATENHRRKIVLSALAPQRVVKRE